MAPTLWFGLLVAAICFEGLARKLTPLPDVLLYFAKDLVLISGLFLFRIDRRVLRTALSLYRGFGGIWVVACVITVLQVFNPEHRSTSLGVFGVRAYWLWWIAPIVISSALRSSVVLKRAALILGLTTIVVAGIAAYQFNLPATHILNSYAWSQDGPVAMVGATQRVRVSSTFSYITGFTDFVIIMTPVMLALGMGIADRRVRLAVFSGAIGLIFAGAMAGSRSVLVLAAVTVPLTVGIRGLFAARRRTLGVAIAIGLGIGAALYLAPDAIEGVLFRFEHSGDTQKRFEGVVGYFPPGALAMFDYPVMGIGTAMMHNSRTAFGVVWTEWWAEAEAQRILIELGPVGYVFVWATRLGLVIALLRARRILQRIRDRGHAGLALGLVPLSLVGNIFFDHVFQALYFVTLGYLLSRTLQAVATARQMAASARAHRS